MLLILGISLVVSILLFRPSLEITRERDILLFYNTKYGRDYVKLMKL